MSVEGDKFVVSSRLSLETSDSPQSHLLSKLVTNCCSSVLRVLTLINRNLQFDPLILILKH